MTFEIESNIFINSLRMLIKNKFMVSLLTYFIIFINMIIRKEKLIKLSEMNAEPNENIHDRMVFYYYLFKFMVLN